MTYWICAFLVYSDSFWTIVFGGFLRQRHCNLAMHEASGVVALGNCVGYIKDTPFCMHLVLEFVLNNQMALLGEVTYLYGQYIALVHSIHIAQINHATSLQFLNC